MPWGSRFRIHELPDDVLAQVFKWHALLVEQELAEYDSEEPEPEEDEEEDSIFPRYRLRRPLPWIVVVPHVCKKWRQIALSNPRLWSEIDLRSRPRIRDDFLHAILSRSKQAPLSVTYDKRATPSFTTILDEAGTRLWKLRIEEDHKSAYQLLRAYDLPRLRSLELSGHADEIIEAIPANLAQLEELSLDSAMWSWDDLRKCSSLRSLTIVHFPYDGPFLRYTLRGGHRALQNMSNLRHLQLLILWDNHRPLDSGAIASLPLLQSVELGYDPLSCSALLDAIDFPADARIALNIETYEDAPETWDRVKFADFWRVVGRKVSRSTHPFRTVMLQTDSDLKALGVVTVRGWAHANAKVPTRGFDMRMFLGMLGDPVVNIPIPCLERGETVVEGLDAFPTASTTSLWVSGTLDLMSRDAFSRVCARMSHVKELHLLSWEVEDVAWLLRPSPTPSSSSSVLFPNLRELVYHEVSSMCGGFIISVDDTMSLSDKMRKRKRENLPPNPWDAVRLAVLERERVHPRETLLKVDVQALHLSISEMAGAALRDVVAFRERNDPEKLISPLYDR